MPSLMDIKADVDKAKPQAKPIPQQVLRGDDLIKTAIEAGSLDPEDVNRVDLFLRSKDLLDTKISEDPEYEQQVLKRIDPVSGDKLVEAIIDEADNLRLEYLRKNDPSFNQKAAAGIGFIDEALFGQFSKLSGKAGELINGEDYETAVRREADRIRLLQKEFPKTDFVARAASYFIPGSPARAVFNGAAKATGKLAGKTLAKVAANPNLLKTVIKTGAAAGVGAGSVEAVKRSMGQDLEEFDLDRGVSEGLKTGVTSALIGGATPVAGRLLGAGAKAAQPMVNDLARGIRNTTAKGVEELSGTPAKGLRAFNKDSEVLRKAFGSEADIGDDISDFLLSARRSKLPEVQQAEKLLTRFDKVESKNVVNFLRGQTKGLDPAKDSQVAILHEWADRIENVIGKKGKVDASKMRDVVDELQEAAADEFGKQSNFLGTRLKQASRIARQSIVDVANKSGEEGKLYNDLMSKASEKRGLIKWLGKSLGKDEDTIRLRSESFVKRLLGPNKTVSQKRMQQLDQAFGTRFFEQAQLAEQARAVGPNGVPPLFSRFNTGRSNLGTSTGAALGGAAGTFALGPGAGTIAGAAVGGALGNAASSPRTGAYLIGRSDAITGFMKRMFASPEALARIKNKGTYPIEVRRIAAEIEKGLIKDGPVTASGITRLVADTAYFVGLVHAFEMETRNRQEKRDQRVTEYLRQNQRNDQIATPQPGVAPQGEK